VATPDTPEQPLPRSKYTPVRPTKSNFSPQPTKLLNKEEPTEVFGLVFPHRQQSEEEITAIMDISVISASPLLQEQIRQILCDHSIDTEKMQRDLRYMGIAKKIFLQYCQFCYSFHYWSQLGHEL